MWFGGGVGESLDGDVHCISPVNHVSDAKRYWLATTTIDWVCYFLFFSLYKK